MPTVLRDLVRSQGQHHCYISSQTNSQLLVLVCVDLRNAVRGFPASGCDVLACFRFLTSAHASVFGKGI